MLFPLYVNDLPTAVKASKGACFADDTKVLKQIGNLQDTVGLQIDINNLNSWTIDNGLTFNETKCKCQRITRKKTPVEYSLNESALEALREEKDLGAWVSCELLEEASYRAEFKSKQTLGIGQKIVPINSKPTNKKIFVPDYCTTSWLRHPDFGSSDHRAYQAS